MKSKPTLILLLILLKPIVVDAEFRTYTFKHLTENVALKQSDVNCIYQDSSGLMHFGTNEGLFLYDGYRSVLCWNITKAGEELASNNILSITEIDASSRLLSTPKGLYVFDIFRRQFSPVKTNDIWFKHASVYNINERFYFVADTVVGRLEIDKKDQHYQAVIYNQIDKAFASGILCHHKNVSGKIILCTRNRQMISWNPNSNQINKIGIQDKDIVCLFEDSNGRIWGGSSNNRVFCWNPLNNKVHSIQLNINKASYGYYKHITSICEDREGNLLIGSNNNGLAIIRASDKYEKAPKIEYYTPEPDDGNSICDNNVTALFCDRSNAIFIGSQGNGMSQLSLGQSCFTQYIVQADDANSLDHIRVNGIHDDNEGSLWFGTRLGLNRLESKTGKYYRYHKLLPGGNNKLPKEVDSIGESTCFCEDSIGNLWIGTYGTGLFMYEKAKDRFYQFKNAEDKHVPADRITDVTIDQKGRLWIATHGAGVICVDSVNIPRQQLFYAPFKYKEQQSLAFDEKFVDIIFADMYNNLWFSVRSNGLFRYDLDQGILKHFKHIPGDSTSLSNDAVISICSDRDHNLWFGTRRGLNKFDIKKEAFTSYTMQSGLPHNSIGGVLSDDSGNIWLYTQRGIYRFNPYTESFNRFIENSRIVHEDQTIDATCVNKEGKMFLGTINNGCIEFHPDSIRDNLFLPTLNLSDLKISGQSIYSNDNAAITSCEQLQAAGLDLNYQQSDVSIEYLAYAYHKDLNLKLNYMLDGFDNEWQATNERKLQVAYSNLNPGQYTFKVKVSNSLLPNQYNESELPIVIHPPYWATIWAYAFYFIIFVLISMLLYRYTVSRLRLKNDLQMERMKLGFFTNISHEFRTPLTLISGPLKKLMAEGDMARKERSNYYSLMHSNTEKMLKLVNQILDIRKIDNRKMVLQAEHLNIVDLAAEVFNNFSVIAQERDINFVFKSDAETMMLWLDRDKLDKILYNLLSNAFKYSPDNGSIELSIEEDALSKMVQIRVKDAGSGIPETQLNQVFNRFYRVEDSTGFAINGTGLGLSIVKSFAEMHSGIVEVNNNEGEGCTFVVSLPKGDQHLSEDEKLGECGATKPIHQTAVNNSAEETNADAKKAGTVGEESPLVLIVEDNAEVRQFISGELKHAYRIETAVNGKEGLEKAIEYFPDVIVSDVMMPQMDGLEFCRLLKQDIRICHIPVTLLTARSSGDHQIEGIETGADAYITKPFDPVYLEARIRNLIQNRQQLKSAFSNTIDRATKPKAKMGNPLDEQLIEKATDIVIKHMEDPEFSVPEFTLQMGMSNSVFYRKIKALTGLSAGEFIKHIRMQKALELLNEQSYTIAEIANKVGFNDPKYFSTAFRKAFGKSPKQYIKNN